MRASSAWVKQQVLEVLVFDPECVTFLLFSVMKVCEQLDFKAVFGEYLTIHSLSTRALPSCPQLCRYGGRTGIERLRPQETPHLSCSGLLGSCGADVSASFVTTFW